MTETALTIVQDCLDHQSERLMARDWDAMHQTVSVPYLRRFTNTETIIETHDEFQTGFETVRKSLETLGVNTLVRLATDARRLSANYIEGFYVSHALNNGARAMPSYNNRAVLRSDAGTWKMIELESRLFMRHWPPDFSILPQSVQPPLKGSKDDARMSATQPETVYQTYLNALAEGLLRGDYDHYASLHIFPLQAYGPQMNLPALDKPGMRKYFDVLCDMVNGVVSDRMERKVIKAEFIACDLICGYHETKLFKDDALVFEPVRASMLLRRKGTAWLMESITNGIENEELTRDVQPAKKLITQIEIKERTRKCPTSQ